MGILFLNIQGFLLYKNTFQKTVVLNVNHPKFLQDKFPRVSVLFGDKSECNGNCFPIPILSDRNEKNMFVSAVQESSIDLDYGLAMFECIDAFWKSSEEAVEVVNIRNNTIILVVRLCF